jgi:RNA recognition motif-containing protein
MSRVYVGNLDSRATERELEDEFRVYGVLRRLVLFFSFQFFPKTFLFIYWVEYSLFTPCLCLAPSSLTDHYCRYGNNACEHLLGFLFGFVDVNRECSSTLVMCPGLALLQFGNWIWVHTLIKKEPIWLKRTNWSWVLLLLLLLLHLANVLLQSLIFLQLGFFNYEAKERNKNPTRNRS